MIDLSADFRLNSQSLYQEFYDMEHPAPSWLDKASVMDFLSSHELSWEKSPLIASPGCYPTSIIVPIAPLACEWAHRNQ